MNFPQGYLPFHRDNYLNYQLNRWYSLGYTRREDLQWAGESIRSYEDYVDVFLRLAEEARAEGRGKNAAFYLRAAEFLVDPQDQRKLPLYEQFQGQFPRAFSEEGWRRHRVPYQNGYLPILEVPARKDPQGVILACGGFDSLIEEFYGIWQALADNGWRVIAFEGPGQGGALRTHGLTFDHDWEKPTQSVLDFFKLQQAALLGISMGGYWALRAAAFEKRISRVIAFPPVYDWLEMTSFPVRRLVGLLMKRPELMNSLVRFKMTSRRMNFIINQALFITGKRDPIDAVAWMLGMNQDHLHSLLVDQDVLLLGGENDAFQPPILLQKQRQALTGARSIQSRIFTQEQQADQHCQMGNLGLAVKVMLEWLDTFPGAHSDSTGKEPV